MNQELFSLPSMEIKKTIKSPLTTEFVFEHLENGLATTWGNTFRRLLLTQVPGWAIFAAKISDKEKTINNEIASLEGVKEIPIYLIFHLKKLVFQSPREDFSRQGRVCVLQIDIDNSQSKEEYVVTGKDIQGELKVLNPETYLATVAPNSQLKITLYCRYYYAFQTAKEQKAFFFQASNLDDESGAQIKNEKNLIFLDSDYCPVKTVSWQEELMIVDLNKQEERLKLTITTNGSVSSQNSLLTVIEFLRQSLTNIQQSIVSEPLKARIKKEKVTEEE